MPNELRGLGQCTEIRLYVFYYYTTDTAHLISIRLPICGSKQEKGPFQGMELAPWRYTRPFEESDETNRKSLASKLIEQ